MKKYLLSLAVLLAGTVAFTSCDDDDDNGNGSIIDPVLTHNVDGVYVLNEGSYYSQINGSLDFLRFDGEAGSFTMMRNVFDSANGRSLGGTPNNAVMYADSVLCIAVSDENRVEFVNARNNVAYDAVSISNPREIAVEGEYVFVTSWAGKVYKIDMRTRAITGESTQIKGNLEGIAAVEGSLYVCTAWNPDYSYNKEVVVLDAQRLVPTDTITVVENPVQAIAANGGNVYVLSQGNYYDVAATVQCIDRNGNVSVIGNATMMAYDELHSKLYLVNAPYGEAPTYKVFDETDKTTADFALGTTIFSPYAISVMSLSGEVFISSLSPNPDAPEYASYTTDGMLYRFDAEGSLLGSYTCGVCPGTIVCRTHTEVKGGSINYHRR